jgi:alpha-glucosidase (family GH31 glycosyl hydrolase)
LEYQDDPNTEHIDLQYLFGASFLVAPILTRANQRRVYLPAGTWYDFWTKEKYQGGRWMAVESPLDTLPLWVKAGAILPLGPAMDYVDQVPLDPLTLEIFGPAENGELTIFDEDQPEIQIRYACTGKQLTLAVSPTPGQVEIILHDAEVIKMVANHPSVELSPQPGSNIIRIHARTGAEIEVTLK